MDLSAKWLGSGFFVFSPAMNIQHDGIRANDLHVRHNKHAHCGAQK